MKTKFEQKYFSVHNTKLQLLVNETGALSRCINSMGTHIFLMMLPMSLLPKRPVTLYTIYDTLVQIKQLELLIV